MTAADWDEPSHPLYLAIYLNGSDDPDRAIEGHPRLADDDFLVLINARWEPLDFVIPSPWGRGRRGRPR